MSWHSFKFLVGIAFWLGGIMNSAGFQQVPLTVEELASRADWIVRGSVEAVKCQKDSSGRIYTQIDFKVLEVWKGQLEKARILLVHSGGEFEGRRVSIPGQVEYAVGQEAVAFLVVNSRGEGVTVGLTQGKFQIWKDTTTGELVVQNHVHNSVPRIQSLLKKEANQPIGPIPLSQLRQMVQGGLK